MAYKHTNKLTPGHLDDWVIHCDICGMPCWFSDATVLDQYTGKGGLLVCPNDVDAIDYGLIPYTIPPESIVTTTRINETIYTSTPDTTYAAFNPTTTDPMSISDPNEQLFGSVWEDQTLVNWNALTSHNWETMI